MEGIVAVELVTPSGVHHYIVTFGRIQDPVDPAPLGQLVRQHASKFGLGDATSVRVCGSLQEARRAPYFYEALIRFGAEMAASRRTDDHAGWVATIDHKMRDGQLLHYLGDPEAAWTRRT
jgi:hypothetical protein